MNKKTTLLIFLGFLAFFEMKGSHLIGGYMRYDHLGDGLYKIQLFIYRDCDPLNGGADFDYIIPIAVYSQNPNGSYRLERDLSTNLQNFEESPIPEDPCLELPPRLCVETGYYELEYRVNNWPRNNSLIFAHQRCCRNSSITNVINPGQEGVTFFVELTPQAMNLGNSSPKINNLPPLATCLNTDINFKNEVDDINNNTLTFEFCSPVVGGGLAGSFGNPGFSFACNGVIPSPACAPPYRELGFRNPYSPTFPIGGSPSISIDRNTGVITGIPNTQGQFVGAICITEWNNGEKIGEIRVEFQTYVTECNSKVNIELEDFESISDNEIYIKWCDSLVVEIKNSTTINSFIEKFKWTFDINGTDHVSEETNFSHNFPEYGRYHGSIVVNPGLVCTDSLNIILDVLGKIEADFNFELDSCNINGIVFEDKSVSVSEVVNYLWDFGDGNTSNEIHPSHSFADTGITHIYLETTHFDGCKDTASIELDIIPEITFYLPNAFKPNAGDINAIFNGQGYLDGYKKFDLRIFNRYGQEVFHTDDFNTGWNGRLKNSGSLLESGTYVYKINIIDPRGNNKVYEGNLQMIR